MPITSCTVFDCRTPRAPVPMASFAVDANGDGHLGYGLRYLERPDAFPLDPKHLPLSHDTLLMARRQDGTYGVLSDAGPNAWGVRLTNSMCKRSQRPLPATPVEWLLKSWHYGSGCLGFSEHHTVAPHLGFPPAPSTMFSARLLSAMEAFTADPDAELDDEARSLLFPGGSLGGVRPKTVVMHDGREHIAKFSRQDDHFDVPAAEYATMRLAHLAGVNVPDFELIRIGPRSVFLVARFDRTEDGIRLHYVSAHTLLNPGPVSPDGREYKTSFSYAGIAEAMRPLNDRGHLDSHEVFRRMILNILVGNVDDHLRNHALLMGQPGRFSLAPAFDIVPHLAAATTPQYIGVGAYGAASTMSNALSQCGRFLLTPKEASGIIDEVREAVSNWRAVFIDSGVSHSDVHMLASSFAVADAADRVQIVARGLSGNEDDPEQVDQGHHAGKMI